MLKVKTIFFLALPLEIFISSFTSGQTLNPYNHIIPSAPTVQAYQIFGDVPVSFYTGVPDISIPLYTIKTGNIEVPIVLRYHPHNVKISMIKSSNVALGWTLEAGGMVSRTLVGSKDEFGSEYSVEELLALNPSAFNDFIELSRLAEFKESPEYDIFSYRLPDDNNGKFFIESMGGTNSYTIHKIPRNDYTISYSFEGQHIETFFISNTSGLQYKFKATPVSIPGMYDPGCWMLSSIEDHVTGKIVNFDHSSGAVGIHNYNPFSAYSRISEDVNFPDNHEDSWSIENGLINSDAPCTGNTIYEDYYPLKEITYDNGKITIFTDADGKIDSLTIKNNNVEVKKIIFTKSFRGPADSYFKAEVLDKITVRCGDITENYMFAYEGDGWLNYAGVNTWGFYADNGVMFNSPEWYVQVEEGQRGIVTERIGSEQYPTLFGISRTENFLTEITYPTGGKTVFNYEPGSYWWETKRIGGPPRIRSIADHDHTGQLINYKEYSYSNAHDEVVPGDVTFFTNTYFIYSFEVFILNYLSRRIRNIGSGWGYNNPALIYDTVTVYQKNLLGTLTNGKESYCYSYVPSTALSLCDIWNDSYYYVRVPAHFGTEAKLVKKETYSGTNNIFEKVKCEENEYDESVYQTLRNAMVFRTAFFDRIVPEDEFYYYRDYFPSWDPPFVKFDYSIYLHKNELLKNTTTEYFNNGDSIVNIKSFNYVTDCENRIRKIVTTTSQVNKPKTIEYTYPDDYTEPPYLWLSSRNILSPVVETTTSLNGKTEKVKNEYRIFTFPPDVQKTFIGSIQTSFDTSPYEDRYYCEKYDASGNPLVIRQADGSPVSFIWAYNSSYLVGEIKGASLTDADLTIVCNSFSDTEIEAGLNQIRINYPQAQVITRLYRLDLPSAVISKIIDPNGIAMYYIYDASGRLSRIENDDHKILKEFDYHYKE